jgi:hypothetical protein
MKQLGPIVAVAADQSRPVPVDDREQAMTVVLDFVQPTVSGRRLGTAGDDLEADIARYLGENRR